jgi:hypothetical protein
MREGNQVLTAILSSLLSSTVANEDSLIFLRASISRDDSVNQYCSLSLLTLIRQNHRSINVLKLKRPKMKKLIAALVAGLFAASAFAAGNAPAPADASASAPAASMEASAPKAKKAKKVKKSKKAKKAKKAAASAPESAAAPAASK